MNEKEVLEHVEKSAEYGDSRFYWIANLIRHGFERIEQLEQNAMTKAEADAINGGIDTLAQRQITLGNDVSKLTALMTDALAANQDVSPILQRLADLGTQAQNTDVAAQKALVSNATTGNPASTTGTSDTTGTATTSSNTPAATLTPTPAPAQNQTPPPAEASVPVAASITLTPTAATVAPGQSQQFGAVVDDATGAPLATQPTVSYSAAEGTIDATGLYTAPATAPESGTDTVTATVGEVTEEATVTIPAPAPSGS